MTHDDAFLADVVADPDDDGVRLIYADYLDERGDPLGEFIRVQIELEPLRDDYDDPRANELRGREAELLREHRTSWLNEAAPLGDLDSPYSEAFGFVRGLPA